MAKNHVNHSIRIYILRLIVPATAAAVLYGCFDTRTDTHTERDTDRFLFRFDFLNFRIISKRKEIARISSENEHFKMVKYRKTTERIS